MGNKNNIGCTMGTFITNWGDLCLCPCVGCTSVDILGRRYSETFPRHARWIHSPWKYNGFYLVPDGFGAQYLEKYKKTKKMNLPKVLVPLKLGEKSYQHFEYVGNWKNGFKHGKGTSYYHKNGAMDYNGDWNITPEGNGIEYYSNGQKRYEGKWLNGKFHSNGTKFYISGEKEYEGRWISGKKSGKGTSFYKSGEKKYEGRWLKGKKYFEGISYNKNGQKIYEGEWKHGKYHRKGISYYKNGQKLYEGEWYYGKHHGKGILYQNDESVKFDGNWEKGIVRKGVYFPENDEKVLRYEGCFDKDKKPHNNCSIFFKNGVRFDGTFENGSREGFGRKTFQNGDHFAGCYSRDKRNGQGVFFEMSSGKSFSRKYFEGLLINEKEIDSRADSEKEEMEEDDHQAVIEEKTDISQDRVRVDQPSEFLDSGGNNGVEQYKYCVY